MKIGLDVRLVEASGIGTTIRGFLDHLEPSRLNQLILFGHDRNKIPWPTEFSQVSQKVYSIGQHWSYGRFLNRQKLDLFHMPHYDVPLSYRGPLVITVHDLIHYLFPEFSTKPFTGVYSGFLLKNASRKARKIICVSQNTKKDLLSLVPEVEPKISVLYSAAEPIYKSIPADALQSHLNMLGLKSGYLLYVGNLRSSKNTKELLAGYAEAIKLNPDLPDLVLAGKNFLDDVNWETLNPKIRYIGVLKRENLPALYNGASLFVFPSLYEGFGIPPLEAMACGTPVLVSKAASLPEVCGEAAMYLDTNNAEGIAKGITRFFKDVSASKRMNAAGLSQASKFSWPSFADGIWKVYEDALRGSGT